MGASQSRDDDDNEDLIEVYLLFKELNANKYTTNQIVSHHTCLFKCKDGSFYYTELDVDTKGGPCQLHLGRYNFLTMPIFYKPMGLTRKTLNDIIAWVKEHKSAGTSYTLLFNDCQVYARSCIEFLKLFDITRNPSNLLQITPSMLAHNSLQGVMIETMLDKTMNIRCASSPAELRLS